MDFKEINIGQMIEKRVAENFFKCTEDEVEKMYQAKSLDTEILLKWSKLLDYDFFRIYTQHLILYSPPSAKKEQSKNKKSSLPQFRKNIYSREIIDFILEEYST
ncbi:transposase [Daejeonia sp. YH14]|uniref:transposase n=1 Tax=Daejeonia sp. YH14 TaxID=3439042 RepID=UPI003F4968DB